MIGTSFWEYVGIRTSIFVLRSITPICILYTIVFIIRPFNFPTATLLFAYAAIETGFYLLIYLPRTFHLQAAAKHPERLPRESRRILFENCAEQIQDPERYLSKWFHDAPLSEIKEENLKDFFRWAFMNTDKFDPADEEELDEYVYATEKLLGRGLAPGRGEAIPLRLTIDAFYPQHRPLIWYMIVSFVDALTFCWLRYHSFQFYRSSLLNFFKLFPLRPIALFTRHRSPAQVLTYWYRPHTSKTKPPILFIHGIGIGLWPYVNFLGEMAKIETANNDEQVGIIALETMPISFRITIEALPREEMCREIQRILNFHCWDEFMLISHSYGSAISTHLLHDPEIGPKIGPVIFVDPVNFLLHLPDVAYNFTYRNPKHANEYQLQYMASKDLGVAHTLARHFFWSENILWKYELGDRRVTVILAGRDLIVDTETVGAYVAGADDESRATGAWKEHKWVGRGIEVVFFEELDHAQVFDRKERTMDVVGIVRGYLRRESFNV